jgi:NAD(P)H dehydrogenase (quinone)
MPTAVIGASGKTGRAVSASLRARGEPVRPVGRDQWLRLEESLAGCTAVYVIAPNLFPDEPDFVATVLRAASAAGVERVGYHSVAAPFAPDLPHHLGKARAEDLVRRSCHTWSILQPCAYVQNFVPALRTAPRLTVPYDVDSRFGLVDLVDVADAAAAILLDGRHAWSTCELGGPALVSVRDVARAASGVLDVDVPVHRVDEDEWFRDRPALPALERAWLSAMFGYYDRHGLPVGSTALRAILGREPHGLVGTLRRELAALSPT